MSRSLWCLLLGVALSGCRGLKATPPADTAQASNEPGESSTDSAGDSDDSADVPLECPSGETPCPDGCADTRTDPTNCGGCGIVCVVPQGAGSCIDGICGVGLCDDGWGDCDGIEDNGCETESSCSSSAEVECTTRCDSLGTLDCTDACAPSCRPPVEACNHLDDDCDGVCDNGELAGCRTSIYRTNGSLGHMYGPDLTTMEGRGQTVESEDAFFVYSDELPGTRALYRCDKGGGRTFLTTASTCELGVTPDLVIGYISTDATCGGMPLYRLYSGEESDHLYTVSESERDHAIDTSGYHYESVIGYVYGSL